MEKPNIQPIVKDFVAFITKKMDITAPFKIKIAYERTPEFKTMAYYSPDSGDIGVYAKGRQTADVLRSIAHEMQHHKQNQDDRLNGEVQDIGGEIEDEANAVAGRLVKEFGYTTKHNIFD